MEQNLEQLEQTWEEAAWRLAWERSAEASVAAEAAYEVYRRAWEDSRTVEAFINNANNGKR